MSLSRWPDISRRGRPLVGANGSIDEILVIVQNLTKYKQVESDRSQLAAIVESSEDATFSQTLDGLITSWNNGAANLFSYAAAEVVGQPVSILSPNHRNSELSTLLQKRKE
jgi:PAS domain-containing protein